MARRMASRRANVNDIFASFLPVRDIGEGQPLQPRMGAVTVVVTPELEELHLQIGGGPEKGAVQAFPSNRANESFDEWMRDRRVRHRVLRQYQIASPAG